VTISISSVSIGLIGYSPHGSTLSPGQITAFRATGLESTCTTSNSITSLATGSSSGTARGIYGSSVSRAGTATATATTMIGSGSGNQPSSPLGKGAIAGVAVGAVAPAVSILVGAWWISRRTRRRQSSETNAPQNRHALGAKFAMASREADSGQIHEVGGG
jgi:hypothetical protein